MTISSKPSPTHWQIDLDDVCVSYGERHVLCHYSQTFRQGECVLLSGVNGCGKTTLLRLLAGLLSPTGGDVRRPQSLCLGYLPQYRRIDRQFPTTVSEVVLSGLHSRKAFLHRFGAEHHAAARHALSRFGILDLEARPIHALSGGQWQRTLLARAFAAQPDLLLLDEPETHLDAASRRNLAEVLVEEMARGAAAVIVSHDEETVRPALLEAGARELHFGAS